MWVRIPQAAHGRHAVDIGEAITAMVHQGQRVTNERWRTRPNSTVTYAFYVPETDEHEAFFAWVGPDGKWDPMTFSQTNLLARDWEIFDPEEA